MSPSAYRISLDSEAQHMTRQARRCTEHRTHTRAGGRVRLRSSEHLSVAASWCSHSRRDRAADWSMFSRSARRLLAGLAKAEVGVSVVSRNGADLASFVAFAGKGGPSAFSTRAAQGATATSAFPLGVRELIQVWLGWDLPAHVSLQDAPVWAHESAFCLQVAQGRHQLVAQGRRMYSSSGGKKGDHRSCCTGSCPLKLNLSLTHNVSTRRLRKLQAEELKAKARWGRTREQRSRLSAAGSCDDVAHFLPSVQTRSPTATARQSTRLVAKPRSLRMSSPGSGRYLRCSLSPHSSSAGRTSARSVSRFVIHG